MLIKLTSTNTEIKDNTIVLNSESIVSIYRLENDESTEVTYVFCPPHGTWEVEETPAEIVDLIKSHK